MVRYTGGAVNHWSKAERPSVYIENGHVAAMTLAVIDVEKETGQGQGPSQQQAHRGPLRRRGP